MVSHIGIKSIGDKCSSCLEVSRTNQQNARHPTNQQNKSAKSRNPTNRQNKSVRSAEFGRRFFGGGGGGLPFEVLALPDLTKPQCYEQQLTRLVPDAYFIVCPNK